MFYYTSVRIKHARRSHTTNLDTYNVCSNEHSFLMYVAQQQVSFTCLRFFLAMTKIMLFYNKEIKF